MNRASINVGGPKSKTVLVSSQGERVILGSCDKPPEVVTPECGEVPINDVFGVFVFNASEETATDNIGI